MANSSPVNPVVFFDVSIGGQVRCRRPSGPAPAGGQDLGEGGSPGSPSSPPETGGLFQGGGGGSFRAAWAEVLGSALRLPSLAGSWSHEDRAVCRRGA